MQTIKYCFRTARKPHVCGLCGGKINVGDRYHYEFNKDGSDVWSFSSHIDCQFVAQELWYFINPWDGMYEDDFRDGVREFCQRMICPKCDNYTPDKECIRDKCYCLSKCVNTLKEYDFTTVKVENPKPNARYWGFVKKEEPLSKIPGEL